jgi:membrane protein implicated in regulation of membrane protease activity
VTRLRRYALYQVPGVAAVVLGVWVLWPRIGLPVWSAIAVIAGWIAKDIALYPVVKHAYDAVDNGDPARLVGREATVIRALAPCGHVRVGGERWRACVVEGGAGLVEGQVVTVVSVHGLTLTVGPVDSVSRP